MSVEDIHFLHQYGKKENKIIFVDSSARNRYAYPHPNQYTIEFAEPFYNVYGVDVLDASVPRTMFNVDYHNNKLVVGAGIQALSDPQTIFIYERDYNLTDLAKTLTAAFSSVNGFAINVISLTNNKPKLRFTAQMPFAFDMSASTMAECLGFDEHAEDGSPFYDRIPSATNPKLYGSKTTDLVLGDKNFTSFPSAGTASTTSNRVTVSQTNWVAQRLEFGSLIFIRKMTIPVVRVNGSTTAFTDIKLAWRIYTDDPDNMKPDKLINSGYFTFQSADATFTNAATFVADNLDTNSFNLIGFSPASTLWLVIYEETATGEFRIIYDAVSNLSDANIIFYTHTVPVTYDGDGNPIFPETLPTQGTTPSGSGQFYTLCIDFTTITKSFQMEAPGIVSLVGERFVIMRCPEIEQYVFGSVAYGNNAPGLALFKLGTVGYAESRFDFSSISYKEFHPIGKLPKLTFRFERLSRELYDFKGVNHHLLIVVRYLVPDNKKFAFTRSSINPNYQIDFLQYLKTQQERENTMDSDDEDDEYDSRKNADRDIRDINTMQMQKFKQDMLRQEAEFDEDEELNYMVARRRPGDSSSEDEL